MPETDLSRLMCGRLATDEVRDEDLIAVLEEALCRAKTGEVTGIALVSSYAGGEVTYEALGRFYRATMVGGLEMLKLSVMDAVNNDEDEHDA